MNNSGTGAASGTTYNGSAPITLSYNTIGAQPLLTNPVTGTGTTNFIPIFTGSSAIGNSNIEFSRVGNSYEYLIGTNNASDNTALLTLKSATESNLQFVNSATLFTEFKNSFGQVSLRLATPSIAGGNYIFFYDGSSVSNRRIYFQTEGNERVIINQDGTFKLNVINNATTDTDKFLVSDAGVVKYRTGAEVLSDIGGQSALTNPVTGTGTTNFIPKFTGASTIGDSQIFEDTNKIGYNTASPIGGGGAGDRTFAVNANSGSAAFITGMVGGTRYSTLFTSSSNFILETNAAIPILFNINNSTKATLDTSGNLGLGVTPSAWWSGYKVEQIGYAGSIYAHGSANVSGIGNNFYLNSAASARVYINNGTASRFELDGNEFVWYQAPSGTAGNAITFTQAMTLDASGNLALGTTSPSSTTWNRYAQIEGVYPGLILNSTASGGVKYSIGSDASTFILRDETSAATRMAVNSSGNVGIGTASPSSKFEVIAATNKGVRIGTAGTLTGIFSDATSPSGILEFSRSGDGVYDSFIAKYESSTNSVLALYGREVLAIGTNGSERMRITSGGNVGIGTDTPATLLNLKSSTTTELRLESVGGTFRSFIGFRTDGQKWDVGVNLNDTNDALSFNSVGSEKMRITSGGNVGINTASPSSFAGYLNTTLQASGANGVNLDFKTSGGTREGVLLLASGTEFALIAATSIPLTFRTNDTERMRITSAGDMYLTGRSTNGDYAMYFFSNDTDSRIYSSNSSGVSKPIQFYTSGTERMRITSGGNVQQRGYTEYQTSNGATSVGYVGLNGPFEGNSNTDFGIASYQPNLYFYTNNNTTPRLTIASTGAATFSSSIKTAAPSGGTAKPWKLGNAVSGGAPSTTHYIEIEIDGTTYYLAAGNTPP
jgi:hypothetical protein